MAIQGRYIMRKGKKWLAAAVSAAMLIQPMAGIGSVYAADGVDIASTFTDSTFRKYVSENFDTDGNGYLSDDEIAAVKTVDVSKGVDSAISSLKGIDIFSNLMYLDCNRTGVKNLDIQGLTNLTYIDVSGNNMSSMTLPVKADNLVYLDVSSNFITSLTSLADYDNLTYLNANNTNLSSIAVDNMKNLGVLGVSGTTISSLDLSANTKLTALYCQSMSSLSALDVSDHTALKLIQCDSAAEKVRTSLTKLDVSGDTALETLDCSFSNISDLNITNTPNLLSLDCSDSQLTDIDVSANTKLTSLNVSGNTLETLDVKANTALTTLKASNIGLTDIDISSLSNMEELELANNQLSKIDISKCPGLKSLNLSANNLECIDLSKTPALESLILDNNHLVCIDISKCPGLFTGLFSCADNSRDIMLEKPNYDFDLTKYSKEYGFYKWYEDSEFPVIEDPNGDPKTGRQDDTVGYAGIAVGKSGKIEYKMKGGSIDGYHISADPDAKKITYDYFYGYGKNRVGFTLNILNPLTVVVWYETSEGITKTDNATLTFKVGESTTFVAKDKSGAAHENIKWSSSNDKVAKIDSDTGELTCVAAGSAQIFVILNGRAIGYVDIECHNPVSSMTFVDKNKDENGNEIIYTDGSVIEMDAGSYATNSSKQLAARFYSDDGLVATEFSEYTCKVTDADGNETKDVVVFSGNRIIAKGAGTAYLHFTSKDNPKTSITIQVNVTQRANSIELATQKLSMIASDTYTLVANVLPSTTGNQELTWTSSDTEVVTVDENGKLTAVTPGTAVITCTSKDVPDNVYAKCNVTVQEAIEGIKLDITEKTLLLGSSGDNRRVQLTSTITASDPSIYTQTWSSSNTDVVTVNRQGLVNAVAPGEATITCALSENIYATCKITVKQLVTGITFVVDSNNMVIGEKMTINTTVTPDNADNAKLVWTSSDTAVATVDDNGVVTAIGKGTATITATASDESGRSRSININVKKLVSDITIDVDKMTVYVNKTQRITATVMPEDASNIGVIWESSNTDVATVSNGTVRGCAAGTATITCTSRDGSNISRTCEVTVLQQIQSITFDATSGTMNAGDTYTLTYKIAPENADNAAINWTSSDEAVATVDENGVITAVGRGSAIITATAADGIGAKATYRITVNQPVTGVKLDATSKTLAVGKTARVTATVTPDTANNKQVEWTSSNEKVATVSGGTITAVGKGSAIISCKTTDGTELVATCKVTVIQPVTSIKLNATKKTLVKGKTVALKATVGPTSASNKSVTWKSSNKKVATVTASGVVKAVGKGTAVITCTAKDGSKVSAKCTITSVIRVTKVKLSKSRVAVKRGKKVTLKAAVTPTTASNRAVVWKSSNSKIATVTQKGVVTAKKKGRVVITCKAKDGSGKYAKCTVVVK